MNKQIYAILTAVLLLFGFASTVSAQDLPGKTTLDSVTGDITVAGTQYNVTVYLAVNDENQRHQVVLDVNTPPITPPWSHQIDLGIELQDAESVTLDVNSNIVTTFDATGAAMQKFQIEQHQPEWRDEYPLRMVEILNDGGDAPSFPYRSFDGATVLDEHNTVCGDTRLGVALVTFDGETDPYHLVVYRINNPAPWDNKLVIPDSSTIVVKDCAIEVSADDGRTLVYTIEAWPDSGDINAMYRIVWKEVKTYYTYAPFRGSLNLKRFGIVQCTFQETDDTVIITCVKNAGR